MPSNDEISLRRPFNVADSILESGTRCYSECDLRLARNCLGPVSFGLE